MPFRFVYRTADISALSRSLESADIYISCSVHKCEWHSIFVLYIELLFLLSMHFFRPISKNLHVFVCIILLKSAQISFECYPRVPGLFFVSLRKPENVQLPINLFGVSLTSTKSDNCIWWNSTISSALLS